MKATYRGFTITAKRERALGGWENLYYSVVSPTGRFVVDSFTTGDDTVREYIGYMKERIDAELADDPEWGTKSSWE